MKSDCIFCKIITGQIPAQKFSDSDDIVVIYDIAPKAPTHLLIIPKKHIHDLASVIPEDMHLIMRMMSVAQQIAQANISTHNFRLMINNGPDAGQSVFHLHMHFLAGKKMSE